MCRMLGYVTRTPATLADLLGEPDLQDFAELSRKHGDGWGFARAVGDVMEVTKAADAARTSSLFSRVTHQVLADLAIVHLRRATMGLPVADCNAHPFSDGRTAFAHNGWIRPPAAVEALLPAETRLLLQLSGIASAGRETAGQQVTGLPEQRSARPDVSSVTWEDLEASPSAA
jgi:predicted glutamine amidotransferase